MAATKIAPALATGNTTILKVRSGLRLTGSFSLTTYQPSEITPLTALKLAGLINEAGYGISISFTRFWSVFADNQFVFFLRPHRWTSYLRTPPYWEGRIYGKHSHWSQNFASLVGDQFEGRNIGIRRKESLRRVVVHFSFFVLLLLTFTYNWLGYTFSYHHQRGTQRKA